MSAQGNWNVIIRALSVKAKAIFILLCSGWWNVSFSDVTSRVAGLRLIMTVALAGLIWISGCSESKRHSPTTPQRVSETTISTASLRKYNNVARQALSRMRFASRDSWRQERYPTIMNAVLKYDATADDLFHTKIRKILGHETEAPIDIAIRLTAQQHAAIVNVFRQAGLVFNGKYYDRHEDFLWRLGEPYHLAPASVALLKRLYADWDITVSALETVLTDSNQANRALADAAFLAPDSLREWAVERDLESTSYIESVALHETAHLINNQLFQGDTRKRYAAYANNLPSLTERAALTTFYRAREVEEFLADAVELQAGIVGVKRVASRVIRKYDILVLDDTYDPPRRRAAHDASAEFIYQLLLLEEQRLPAALPRKQSIEWLRGRRTTSASWMKRHWNSYLDTILTPDAIERIQTRYLQVFQSVFDTLVDNKEL